MAANFDINLVFAEAPTGKTRRQFVEQVFRLLPHWLDNPQSVATNVVSTSEFKEAPWSAGSGLLEKAIPPGVLLHVYGRKHGTGRTSVTIDEVLPGATYTIAIPKSVVRRDSNADLEAILGQLFALARDVSPTLVFAGPELSVDAASKDLRQVAHEQIHNPGDSEFAVGPKDLLVWKDTEDWAASQTSPTHVILVRNNP